MPDRGGRMFLAFLLIFLGIFFSVVTYFPGFVRADQWWPAFILVPGIAMVAVAVVGGLSRNRAMAAMAIPGCIITTVGLILLYCNVTNRWESWAYAWTLIPASVGLGLLFSAQFGVGDEGAAKAGRWLLILGGAGFLVFGAFFEGLIFGGFVSQWWPVALIILGAFVLLNERRAK